MRVSFRIDFYFNLMVKYSFTGKRAETRQYYDFNCVCMSDLNQHDLFSPQNEIGQPHCLEGVQRVLTVTSNIWGLLELAPGVITAKHE